MPELPEVESVRRGLERHLVGRRVTGVEVFDARELRRQEGGAEAFVRGLTGRRVTAVVRRGKRLWMPLDDSCALSAHLGMSGQLLIRGVRADPRAHAAVDTSGRGTDLTARRVPTMVRELSHEPRHLRVRLHLEAHAGERGVVVVDLVDQRMLGGLHLTGLVPTPDGAPGGRGTTAALIPRDATALARDLLDPALDRGAVVQRMRSSRRAVKTLLMDQALASGVGNIYADEGLWVARLHGARPGRTLEADQVYDLLEATAQVMTQALAVGGTSFDALYVDALGAPGYFARSLRAYGRSGQACGRCGTMMERITVSGRSHVFCPGCQTRLSPAAH